MNIKSKDFSLFIYRYWHTKSTFLYVFLVIFTTTGIGQNTIPLKHKRDVIINGQKYTENFAYTIKGKDTIPQGLYELTKIFSTDSTDIIKSIFAQGNMRNGSPHDNWQIRLGNYSPDEAKRLKDFQISYSIKGDEIIATGVYDLGNKVGIWRICEVLIQDGLIVDTLFVAEVEYVNNAIINKISISKNDQVLDGQINSQKFLDGQWQLKSASHYEMWELRDGLLSSIEVNEPQGTNYYDLTKHLSTVKYSFETHKFNARFLRLLKYIVEKNYPEIATEDLTFFSKNILLEFPEKITPVNHVFSLVNDSEVPTDFLLKIPIINIEPKDSSNIKSLIQQMEVTHTVIEDIKNDVQIKALSERVAKLNEYNNIIDKIYQNYMDPIIGLIQDFDNDVLKYFFTPDYLTKVYQKRDTLDYELLGLSKSYVLRNTFPMDSIVTIESLTTVAKSLELEYLDIKKEIIATIKSLEKKESLVALESALMQEYETLVQKLDEVDGDDLNEIAGFYVYNEVKSFLESVMSDYLSLKDEDKKLEQVQVLLECVEDIGFLVNRLGNIPEDFDTIDRLYINIVFNPYTFTNMDERINPGIYNAFQYTLLPALLGKIKSMECKNVSYHRGEYDILLQGMVDLLKTNNKKVERYVKRTRDPQKIVSLLGINIEY